MATDGKAAEIAADEWLRGQGRTCIGRNLWYPEGEIDWLGWDGDAITLVEIKATSLTPEVAAKRIDKKKVARLILLSERIRSEHPEWANTEIRLEALLLQQSQSGTTWKFYLYQIGDYDE